MLAIDNEKMLHDYNGLKAKQEQKLAEIEQAARVFAINRGYDEETTDSFVKYAQAAENDGLSKEEKTELDVLGKYVYAAEETIAKETVAEETEQAEADDGTLVN